MTPITELGINSKHGFGRYGSNNDIEHTYNIFRRGTIPRV